MRIFLWGSVVVLLFLGGLTAQETQATQKRPSNFDADQQKISKSNEQYLPQQQFLEQALEKQIDSTKYILGPGDQLLIKTWGILENQFISPVTPEGFVVIPGITEVYVANKTLADASSEIKFYLKKAFKNARFAVRLMRLRKFRVFLVGEIRNPGTYYLRASDRLSDATQLAGGLLSWADETRIQLRHLDGSADTVNVNQFYLNGNLRANPLLQGGDVIFVPSIDLQKNYAIIEGNVGSQGVYQLLPGEKLYAFLTRLHAINRRSDIENLVLIRKGQDISFNLLKNDSAAREEVLQKGDRIIIPSTRDRIYVRGEVARPGAFPYLANYLSRDYAGLAGIMETAKPLKDIYVYHYATGKIEKGENVVVQRGDIVVIPRRNREALKDYMSILAPLISLGLSAFAIIKATR